MTSSSSKVNPRLTSPSSVPIGPAQSVAAKNAKLDYVRLIHFSDLVLTCKTTDDKMRLVEIPECKRLRMISEYDEKTGRCVIRRYFKNVLKNDKIEAKEVVYMGVPKEWTYVSHAGWADYDHFVKDFNDKQAKAELKAASGAPKKMWRGKKGGVAREPATMDFWNVVSVVKHQDDNAMMRERTPLHKALWGWEQYAHGDYAYCPYNLENKKKFTKTDAKQIKWSPQVSTDAWEGGVADENKQDPEALVSGAAYTDLLQCLMAEVLFCQNVSQYAAKIRADASSGYASGLERTLDGAKMFSGGKELSETKKKEIEAQYAEQNKTDETELLTRFDCIYMSKMVDYETNNMQCNPPRFGADKKEILAKIPVPYTERIEYEGKPFRPPTDDEIQRFEKEPYIVADPTDMKAYTAEFEKIEAENLKIKDLDKRRLICPPTQTCIDLFRAPKGRVVWDGPRVMRMAHIDEKGVKHKLRELTWKEKLGVLARGAVVSLEVERSFLPSMPAVLVQVAKVKAKITTVFVFMGPTPYRGGRKTKNYDDDEPVPGAQEVSVADFDDFTLARVGGTRLSDEERKELEAAFAKDEKETSSAAGSAAAAAAPKDSASAELKTKKAVDAAAIIAGPALDAHKGAGSAMAAVAADAMLVDKPAAAAAPVGKKRKHEEKEGKAVVPGPAAAAAADEPAKKKRKLDENGKAAAPASPAKEKKKPAAAAVAEDDGDDDMLSPAPPSSKSAAPADKPKKSKAKKHRVLVDSDSEE